MNTEILFCGDAHGRFAHILAASERLMPMTVVLLGDMEFPRPAHLELAPIREITYFVIGNHDTDTAESWANLSESGLADRCIDGRVATLPDGTRVAGLGGVFRAKVWAPPSAPVHESYDAWERSLARGWQKRETQFAVQRRTHRSTIFPNAYERLSSEHADILVLHEAPEPHPHGWSALNELARAMDVRQVIHGHHHDRPDYEPYWRELGYEVHGVGLRGITGRDGAVIRPGELDDARARVRLLQP